MEFRWIEWNVDKVLKHGVDPTEAEEVAASPGPGYPRRHRDGRWLVRGRSSRPRLIQVVYVLDDDGTAFVIHARPLSETERRGHRRRRR